MSGQSSGAIGKTSSDSTGTTSTDTNIITEIVKHLKPQVKPEHFKSLNIHDRVQIIERMLGGCESVLTIDPMRIPKSNDESLESEMYGDIEFDIKNFDTALCFYNISIAFAENDYQYLYSLYGKRADILDKKELFRPSLHSLELAIKYCPSNLQENFKERKEKLVEKFSASQAVEQRIRSECKIDIDSLTKLKNDRVHPNVPFISNCLELSDNETYGRGITTNCDLNPGDIVAIDRAYASILYSSFHYRYCSNCFKENWSLIPCPGCTTVMYCNQKCLQIAWKKFHKHECKISNYLLEIFPNHELMYFRVPLQTIELFGGIDPLIEFEEVSQQMDPRSFSLFHVSHRDIQYDDNDDDDDDDIAVRAHDSRVTVSNYHSVHGLIRDVPEPSNWTIDSHLRTAVIIFLIYRLFRNIFNITTNDQKRFVEMFIYRHIRASRTFNYELNVARDKIVDVNYGSALYPFASLINHSCSPNVMFVNNGSSVTIIVLHPIKAGDQLFFYYGYLYMHNEKSERQQGLKATWNFTCQCIACTEDYPQLDNLSVYCIPWEPSTDLYAPRTDFKLRELIEVIKAMFSFRLSHLKFHPCKEICYYESDVPNYISQLLRRLSGAVCMNC